MTPMGPDDKICYCYKVRYRKLWHFARRVRPKRASQMSECLGAGTGCGWCIPILKKIHEAAEAAAEKDGAASGGAEQGGAVPAQVLDLTSDEYAARREEYIRSGQAKNKF